MNTANGKPATGRTSSWWARVKARIFPEMPDFYQLLVEQCEFTARGTAHLARFLADGQATDAAEVRRLEHEADRVKARNIATLHRAFATPMDREDIYDAIEAIDDVLNYAKSSVREIEVLGLASDRYMAEIAARLHVGAEALLEACRTLEHAPETAAEHGQRARKSEREVEKLYREALAALFDPAEQLAAAAARATSPGSADDIVAAATARAVVIVTGILKQREIYRHLSNAADRVARAAEVLEDIITKAT